MLDNEILELAVMEIAMDAAPNDEQLIERWKRGFDAVPRTEHVLLRLATKILEGKPYAITSDNDATLVRCRAFAEGLGAEVVDRGPYSIVVLPRRN
jgi:hypothetical protein